MTFIGIVSSKNCLFEIKQNIKNNLSIKYNVININNECIENIKNVTFETILILDTKEISLKIEQLKLMLIKAKFVLVNADIKENLDILKDLDLNVITFGFNNKATITASSVEEDYVLICVQRNILDINNKEIEQQEIRIETKNKSNIYGIMGSIGVLLLYNNKNLEKLYKI